MTHQDAQSNSSAALLGENSTSGRHCVVRCRSAWFSVPAVSVREITIAPELVAVPQSHPSLAGLCHLRSEFIPVIELDALLDFGGTACSQPLNKLLVIQGRGVWAIRIAEAAAIESLETLVAPEARMDDGHPTTIIGTAMFRDQIVRVLDPNGICRLAQQVLEQHWIGSQDTPASMLKTGSLS